MTHLKMVGVALMLAVAGGVADNDGLFPRIPIFPKPQLPITPKPFNPGDIPPDPLPVTLPPGPLPVTLPPGPLPVNLPVTLPPGPLSVNLPNLPVTLPNVQLPVTLPPGPLPVNLPNLPITLPNVPLPLTLPPVNLPITLQPLPLPFDLLPSDLLQNGLSFTTGLLSTGLINSLSLPDLLTMTTSSCGARLALSTVRLILAISYQLVNLPTNVCQLDAANMLKVENSMKSLQSISSLLPTGSAAKTLTSQLEEMFKLLKKGDNSCVSDILTSVVDVACSLIICILPIVLKVLGILFG